MRVVVKTRLEAPAPSVWAALQTPKLLQYVAAPLIVFRPLDGPFAQTFADGRKRVSLWLFGVVPLGRQWIDVSRPQGVDGALHIRDNGTGDLVRRWDHLITIWPESPGTTRYQDEVEIEAGPLTPLVWCFAAGFYRWRQRRWRALARRGMRL